MLKCNTYVKHMKIMGNFPSTESGTQKIFFRLGWVVFMHRLVESHRVIVGRRNDHEGGGKITLSPSNKFLDKSDPTENL